MLSPLLAAYMQGDEIKAVVVLSLRNTVVLKIWIAVLHNEAVHFLASLLELICVCERQRSQDSGTGP